MVLNKKTDAQFNYKFNNCLLKFDAASNSSSSNPDYQFETDATHYSNIILNKSPGFQNINTNELNIDNTSAAFAKGNSDYLIPLDILGNTRSLPPDLGAYQSKAFVK
jgi:hypothetical protein